MAHIDDLSIQSLSSLPPEVGLQLILDMRLRRRFVPTWNVSKVTKKSKIADPAALINSLNDEQLQALMDALEKK